MDQGDTPAFLEGGGELGAMMRAYDWSSTPLGPPEGWPRSLKTVVRILLTSQQPFWLGWGPELTYFYNDAYKSIIGGKHPWAMGKPFREVWSEIWNVVGPMAAHVISSDEGTYVEAQLLIMERHGYPEETYYTFSYSPVSDDDGKVAGLVCANTEDTGRVIGERQLSLLSELAARTVDMRQWREAAQAAVKAFATDAHDLPFALLYVEGDDGKLELSAATPGAADIGVAWPIKEALATQQAQQVALAGVSDIPMGAWIRPATEARVLPIVPSGGQGRAGALVVGLNPFRRLDEAYGNFLDLVANQVGAVLASVDAYDQQRRRAEALAELDRAKTLFFSNVSHEFRTPLTLMLGPLEDLIARRDETASEDDREMLDLVHRNGQRLLKLVNTLLDFARIEAGRAQTSFQPTDLSAFTADLAANFRAATERAGLALRVDTPALPEAAWIDREMWEKVILNLLSNAFKFTLQGEIAIAVRDRPGHFEILVSDTGSGIPPDSLPKMFQRFHRVEGTPGRSHEGSGIGLALVQELVKLHGGRIGVESTLGQGTRFKIELRKGNAHLPGDRLRASGSTTATPVRSEEYVEEALRWLPAGAAGVPEVSPGARRVLVADDNADLRDYLRKLLQHEYLVETVADGQEALEAARRELPDLIVSDVMMARLDGLGLVRELRSDPVLRDIPIVLLSARAGEEARIEGMDSGADDYLVKPFSARELQVRVGALLRAADMRREAHAALRRNAAQFAALLDAAPMGVYLIDDRFRIAAVNPVAAPVFANVPNVIGRDFDEVIHILWPQDFADFVVHRFRHTLQTGDPFIEPEVRQKRQDTGADEYYEYQIHRIPLPGGVFGVVAYFREISQAVLAREALRESDRRKDEFIATLSHELRNPLAPIRNSLHILGMKRDDPAIARVYSVMDRQLRHLVRLVDDLLEVSRISRGAFELKREVVELGPIVYHAVELAEPLTAAQGHQVTVSLPDESMLLDVDPVRLGQVLGNVLTNAAKYTPAGGHIIVRAERAGDEVVIRIADNGRGLAPEDLERIFDMFTRGDDTVGQSGLGIGLALARKLLAMHGGTIQAESAGPDRGSEFVIRLPHVARHSHPPGVTSQLGGALDGKRVLVVDDNLDAGDSLAMVLRILGCETRVARSGAEALATLEEFPAAIVLLDIGMPEMDGYEVARRIRTRFPSARPSIVALTGWGQEQDRLKAREAGFDHHLVKPAEIAALQTLLASL